MTCWAPYFRSFIVGVALIVLAPAKLSVAGADRSTVEDISDLGLRTVSISIKEQPACVFGNKHSSGLTTRVLATTCL